MAVRSISFTVYCHPEPQGSSRAFTPKGWKRPIITSANPDLKSFRQEVSKAAMVARQQAGVNDLIFGKHEPVEVRFAFYFMRPPSAPKKRTCHVVRPDADKLCRSCFDALTGIIWADDSQVVRIYAEKHYGMPERVELTVTEYEASGEEYVVKQEPLLQQAADDF